jgi:hypothetical protein
MNFDGFHPFTTLFFFGACCKRGGRLYHTTAPSRCIPASYCHLSAILQTISIIPVNLQDNRAVFRIFISLLRFSFDSTLYVLKYNTVQVMIILERKRSQVKLNPSLHEFPKSWQKEFHLIKYIQKHNKYYTKITFLTIFRILMKICVCITYDT